jgi:hypothetical protein
MRGASGHGRDSHTSGLSGFSVAHSADLGVVRPDRQALPCHHPARKAQAHEARFGALRIELRLSSETHPPRLPARPSAEDGRDVLRIALRPGLHARRISSADARRINSADAPRVNGPVNTAGPSAVTGGFRGRQGRADSEGGEAVAIRTLAAQGIMEAEDNGGFAPGTAGAATVVFPGTFSVKRTPGHQRGAVQTSRARRWESPIKGGRSRGRNRGPLRESGGVLQATRG